MIGRMKEEILRAFQVAGDRRATVAARKAWLGP
jgi:hypothetical protein